jgi:hypothetical protein
LRGLRSVDRWWRVVSWLVWSVLRMVGRWRSLMSVVRAESEVLNSEISLPRFARVVVVIL